MAGVEVFTKLALRMKYPQSERLRKIFEKLVTWEEAEILLEMPTLPDEIAEKLNLDRATVERRIEELYRRGLLVPTSKGYFMPRSITQLHDTTLTDPGMTTELADLWQEFSEEEWFADHRDELIIAEHQINHKIIPMVKALQTSRDILPEEDARSVIQQEPLIAVVTCPCRTRAHLCDAPTDTCIQFRKAAEYVINRGTGRELSHEEALNIIDKAEEHGLLHTLMPYGVLCNCCDCCCNIVRPLVKYGKISQGLAKSSYRAVVNEELCTGCQLCTDQCYFEALTMENGKPVIDTTKCFGCGRCVVSCPAEGALRLELADKIAAL